MATNIKLPGGSSPVLTTGENLFASADTQEYAPGDNVYTKKKAIKINNVGGKIRVKFDLRKYSSPTAYGRIYKNGVAVGTERTTTSATYVTFTEDINVSPGDELQLYAKGTDTAAQSVQVMNFRLYTGVLLPSPVVTDS